MRVVPFLLLGCVAISTAQDQFNSNSARNPCQDALIAADEAHNRRLLAVQAIKNRIDYEFNNTIATCTDEQCRTRAARKQKARFDSEYVPALNAENLRWQEDKERIVATTCRNRPLSGAGADTPPDERPGTKGIVYSPPERKPPQPPAQPAVPPEIATMAQTMDVCLQQRGALPGYMSPRAQVYSGRAQYSSSTVFYDPSYLGRQHPYVAAYWLASAYAGHVVRLERQAPAGPQTAEETQAHVDVITGWLTGCLYNRALLPPSADQTARDPRNLFLYFLGQSDAPLGDDREENFSRGFHESTLTLAPLLQR